MKKWLSKLIGSLTRKKKKTDNNISKEDIAAIYKVPTAYMD